MMAKEKHLFLLFLSLISWAGCQSLWEYDTNATYVYQYEGYVVAGVPGYTNRFSGYQINTDVHLTRGENDTYVIQFSDPDFRPIADYGKAGDPISGDDLKSFSRISEDRYAFQRWAKDIKKALKKPLRFVWSNGLVRDLETTDGDTHWSLNLKKGLLTLISASFDKLGVNASTGVFTASREPSVEGECDADYQFSTSASSKDSAITLFNLRRQRNMNTCYRDPTVHFSSFPFPEVKLKMDIQSEGNYILTVNSTTRSGFFLQNTNLQSRYSVVLSDRNLQPPRSVSRQELTFVKMANRSNVHEITAWKRHKRGMLMFLPDTVTAKRRIHNRNLLKMISKRMVGLGMEPRYSGVSETRMLLELVRMLRRLSSSNIYNRIRYYRQHEFYREQFFSAVGATGTRQAADAIMRILIEHRTWLRDSEAVLLLHQTAISTIAPRYLIKNLKSLARRNYRLRPQVRAAVWTAAGTVFRRLAYIKARNVSEDALTFFKNVSATKYQGLDENAKELALLMAFGNAALPSLSGLIEARMSPENALPIRIQAMVAWYGLAPQMRTRTKLLMRALFKNPEEDIEIRIEAFINLMFAKPTRYEAAIIASQLRIESNDHLRAFAITYLRLLATRSKYDCSSKGVALWLLHSLSQKLLYTSPLLSGVFPLKNAAGPLTGVVLNVIYGPESPLPRRVTVSGSMRFDGKEFPIWGITLRSPDAFTLFQKLMGRLQKPRTSNKNKASSKSKNSLSSTVCMKLFGSHFYGEMMDMNSIFTWWKSFTGNDKNKKKSRQKLQFENSFILDESLQRPSSFGLLVALNRSLVYTGTGELSTRRLTKASVLSAKATGTGMRRVSLTLDSGLNYISHIRDNYITITPGRRRDVEFVLSTDGKFSFLPPKPKFYLPFRLFESGTEVYRNVGGFASYKPNRRPMVPSPRPGRKTEVTRSLLFGAVTEKRTSWPDAWSSTRPWTPSRSVISLPNLSKKCLTFYFNAKLSPKKQKPIPSRPPRNQGKRIRKFYIRDYNMPSSTAPTDDQWFSSLLNGNLTIRVTRSFAKMMDSGPILRYEQDIGFITFSKNESSFNGTMQSNKAKWRLDVKWRQSGLKFVYNPSAPFTIAVNASMEATMNLSVSNRSLAASRLLLRTSPEWGDAWKKIEYFNSVLDLPRSWMRCNVDLKQLIAFGPPRYPDSPACFQAWRRFNAWDKLSLRLERAAKDLQIPFSNLMTFFFTTVKSQTSGTDALISASLHPLDKRPLALRQRLQYPNVFGECELSAYRHKGRWDDKFPEMLRLRGFDNLDYNETLTDEEASENVYMCSRTKGFQFAVTLTNIKEKYPSWGNRKVPKPRTVVIEYQTENGDCRLTVVDMKRNPVRSEGDGCTGSYEENRDSSRVHQGVRIEVKHLQLSLVTSGENRRRFVRLRLGSANFGEVDGLCGQLGDPNFTRGPCKNLPCTPKERLYPLD